MNDTKLPHTAQNFILQSQLLRKAVLLAMFVTYECYKNT